ncbi:MAG: hypothetical protein E7174_01645 [Firmicutes bacterium]|nr:hypothetical protein [Bacillota bacterium]
MSLLKGKHFFDTIYHYDNTEIILKKEKNKYYIIVNNKKFEFNSYKKAINYGIIESYPNIKINIKDIDKILNYYQKIEKIKLKGQKLGKDFFIDYEDEMKDENDFSNYWIRKKLSEKYYKLPLDKSSKNINDKMLYKKYVSTLEDLIEEIKSIKEDKRDLEMYCILNYRQVDCINRCVEVDEGWSTDLLKFEQYYKEMIDFIYYPGFKYNEISLEELAIIQMMASHLILRAKNLIKK